MDGIRKALAEVRALSVSEADAAAMGEAKKRVAVALMAAKAAAVPQEDILDASTAPAEEAAAPAAAGKAEGASSSSSDSYSEVEEEPLDKATLDKANLEGTAAALAFAQLIAAPPPPPPPPPPE